MYCSKAGLVPDKPLVNRSNMCIPNLIKKIHFDPKRPENHNIYISNIKNKYVMIYDRDKWILHNQDETIDDLIDTNEFVLEQKFTRLAETALEKNGLKTVQRLACKTSFRKIILIL